MFHFTGLPSLTYEFSQGLSRFRGTGFPHSEIPGSKVVCTSPRLIAAYHVLHRLHLPRHPLYALYYLTIFFNPFQFPHEIGNLLRHLLTTYFIYSAHLFRSPPRYIGEIYSMNWYNYKLQKKNWKLTNLIFLFPFVICNFLEVRRFERPTPCLQSMCSPSWATPPVKICKAFFEFFC